MPDAGKPVTSLFLMVCVFMLNVAAASPVSADDTVESLSLTPVVGGFSSINAGRATPKVSYGLRAGYDIIGHGMTDSIGIEGAFTVISNAPATDGGTGNGYLFRVEAVSPIAPKRRLVPFLAVGAGGMFARGENSLLLDAGVGLKYFMRDSLAVRVDVRDLVAFRLNSTDNNLEYTLGVSYVFGGAKREMPAAPVPVSSPPVKAEEKVIQAVAAPDGEKPGAAQPGVAERGSGAKAPVPALAEAPPRTGSPAPPVSPKEQPAAPAAKPVAKQTKIISLEGTVAVTGNPPAPGETGVTLTPGNMLVARGGKERLSPVAAPSAELEKAREAAVVAKPLASASANAPAQPAAAGVVKTAPPPSAWGTPPSAPERLQPAGLNFRKEGRLAELTVEFALNSAAIPPEYLWDVRKIALFMKYNPGTRVTIEGHADNTGSDAVNEKLSRWRAESLKSHLVHAGIDPARITVRWHGPSRPVADNGTVAGRQRNRRGIATVTID